MTFEFLSSAFICQKLWRQYEKNRCMAVDRDGCTGSIVQISLLANDKRKDIRQKRLACMTKGIVATAQTGMCPKGQRAATPPPVQTGNGTFQGLMFCYSPAREGLLAEQQFFPPHNENRL